MIAFAPFATLALALLAPVAALTIPRTSHEKTWPSLLEPYDIYHSRYEALDCENKHGQSFFDQCCHPLLANESLESRPAQCIPECDESTTSPAPTATQAPAKSDPKPTTTPAKPKTSPTPSPAADSQVVTGGFGTYFYQNGVAGACGTVHSDYDLIAAMDVARYGDDAVESPLCGKQVHITNVDNGNTVIVKVADACPTCNNGNSIDLSLGAFEKLAALEVGMVNIKWQFV